ncbi:sulfatase [Salipiger aestuarii]|uniref:Phosphoglycerol transferase MdoB-like AlkP superfamily enzyme n=1 Tax=Salipiger aestuarii TaxID=568098 RepID=A0A327YSQ7_9RHOB|nr:sulfatase [Salipiger aestuarii]KAB2543341.1 sulfatase [Salipiger aestuarii]RAK23990.1 hypothetical protein ATI53_100197 [Salipiger aestuarii]
MTEFRRTASLGGGALLLDLVLIQPSHPGGLTAAGLTLMPLELPVLLGGALALGRRARGYAAGVAVLLVVLVALKLADLAAHTAFGRGFDPVTDLNVVDAAFRLLSASIGVAGTSVLAALTLGLLALLGAGLFLGLRAWGRAGARIGGRGRSAAAGIAAAFAVLCGAEIRSALNGWQGWNPPADAFTARYGAEKLRNGLRSGAALAAFKAEAATDAWQHRPGALSALKGRDVSVVFVESYGRAAIDTPAYAPRHLATLAEGAVALEAAGLGIRSGWLTSPVQGGRSWLAHATLASGLGISDQRRYGAMLASDRLTLYDIAGRSGYHTRVVAPAIVLPWPEGPGFGFSEVLAASDLGYAGRPFDWVTMPDQYTLATADRLAPDGPVMSEIALISSHAPWTPVASLVPWDSVGDGRVFDAMATAGPSPSEVWSDHDRVRDHYARALDYSVRTVLSWAALPRATQPLLVVLGDHQPAAFVARGAGMDVPVHLIAPPDVLALFDDWGWTDGPVPAPALAPWPMHAFRDRFLDATSPAGTP